MCETKPRFFFTQCADVGANRRSFESLTVTVFQEFLKNANSAAICGSYLILECSFPHNANTIY